MEQEFPDASLKEINEAVESSDEAFRIYRRKNLKERARFLHTIADNMHAMAARLIQTAARETHLDEARLKVELKRTLFQLTSYADACAEGSWLDIRIDTADPHRDPPRPDLRKMMIPLGPVVVFGASNFPFAYSTAGGDTACALAAGCPVIVKAHPAHASTSSLVSEAIAGAAKACELPAAVFVHLHGASFKTGKALVEHPLVKAVGFTGSFEGGKALFDLANQRPVPIPVFAEMGSVNPVFILGGRLKAEPTALARQLARSITQSAGQFCTNPGILVLQEGEGLSTFEEALADEIRSTAPVFMLHAGIAENFVRNRSLALSQQGLELIAQTSTPVESGQSIPTLARVKAAVFLANPLLHREVFGPFSMLVVCSDAKEQLQVARAMEGQLTTTLLANAEEMRAEEDLVEALRDRCGRMVVNGVPTGVEVALSMHHGGPFPATTDSRFTAVGADGIKRFARPFCFQNWPDELLPDELKNANPLGLWRTVGGHLSRE